MKFMLTYVCEIVDELVDGLGEQAGVEEEQDAEAFSFHEDLENELLCLHELGEQLCEGSGLENKLGMI